MNALQIEELKGLLLLNRLGGGARLSTLLKETQSSQEILVRIRHENLFNKAERLRLLEKTWSPEREIERCDKLGVHFLSFLECDYPSSLRQIPHPPLVLYARGKYLPEDDATVAVVGTRHPSTYGIDMGYQIVRKLSEMGLNIVSGLAQGIDRVAHQACLEVSYGRTLAVLGCGIDQVYPKSNEALYQEIAERGVLLSEYPLDTPPRAENFPKRNRIISGLAQGVFVVEAHSRSGSLITAYQAIEQGKDVFALPGLVTDLTSRGTNALIKQGAYLVECAEDIVDVLALSLKNLEKKSTSPPKKGGKMTSLKQPEFPEIHCKGKMGMRSPLERSVLKELQGGAKNLDELMSGMAQPLAALGPALLTLEIGGMIQKTREGLFEVLVKET